MTTTAIIPVKSLEQGKSRLSHLLSPQERGRLVAGFLAQSLSVLQQVPVIDETLVISQDPLVLKLAGRLGAVPLAEQGAQGLNAAVAQAVSLAVARGAHDVLILPADCPWLLPGDVAAMLALPPAGGPDGHFLVICADRHDAGTNALRLSPPQPFTFHYGPGSYRRHLQEGEQRGLVTWPVFSPGLRFDLDTEADWTYYRQQLSLPSGRPLSGSKAAT